MFKQKKSKSFDSFKLSEVRYCAGAQPYQGADDVFLCVLAFIFARMVVEKLPQKKITPHMSALYKRWGDMLEKNADWLAAMENYQEGSVDD